MTLIGYGRFFSGSPKAPVIVTGKQWRKKAGTVYQQIKAGENFASLAQKHSEDPSGKAGGDLGFIKKGPDGERIHRCFISDESRRYQSAILD